MLDSSVRWVMKDIEKFILLVLFLLMMGVLLSSCGDRCYTCEVRAEVTVNGFTSVAETEYVLCGDRGDKKDAEDSGTFTTRANGFRSVTTTKCRR